MKINSFRFLAVAWPIGGFVQGSRPVIYSPGPQCCQLVSHGNSLLLNFKETPMPVFSLNIPDSHCPSLSPGTSKYATASPDPLCWFNGAGHFLKLFFVL